jgi:hypothetical protein
VQVDGTVVSSQDISLPGNAEQKVSFSIVAGAPGTHRVEVNGMAGSFTVASQAPAGGAAPPPPAPAPARLSTSFSVSSSIVRAGESPVVSVLVKNSGGSAGTCPVSVLVNGREAGAATVEVAPGAARTVDFTIPVQDPGTYTIEVNGDAATFTVASSAETPRRVLNWWLVGAMVALLTAISSTLAFVLRYRAATFRHQPE